MTRRARLYRRFPCLRSARRRRERHVPAPPSRAPEAPAPSACDADDWGAAAVELGLVTELRPADTAPARA